MKNSAVRFILTLIVSSILLPTVTLNREGVYAQDSSPSTTNATILSGDDVSSQRGLQNKSINYFDGSLGYLVYPDTTDNNTATTSGPQQKLPAVVMIHEWWGFE